MSNAAAIRESRRSHRFGRFDLQPGERRLLADGQPIALGARAFDLLVVLVERAGQLVAKNDLLTLVWPGLVVEENNLQVQISTLRKVLGQSALATIPGRGYRFELAVEGVAAVAPAAQPSAAAAPEPVRARTNLPARLLSLYGRAQDLATIKALLREHVVVTVVGAGGIGKTRVAQAVAADVAAESASEFPDGVWWVELAALSDRALVPSAVALALGVHLPGDCLPPHALASRLASQRLLLVLDNCEHLTDAVAELIESVLAAAPQVRFLVTSQETLKTAEEHIYRVGSLALPPNDGASNDLNAGAVELFVARAQAVDPNFALTPANAPTVVEICRRLDGIPLAIELAAARLPLLGVEGLRARLGERFNVLTGGARVVLRRHQTLRATLEWSHGLLTPVEQTVFMRLGVFAGSFALEAAQLVASDDQIGAWAALDHLEALVDKSLVLAEGNSLPRYRLLETTRAYALERLAEAGETERMLRQHALAMCAVLESSEGDDQHWRMTPADIAPAESELDNLRAALAWVSTAADSNELAIALAGKSHRVWMATHLLSEGLERSLALRHKIDDDVPKQDVARFWLTIARLGAYSTRRECFDAAMRAVELYRQLGSDNLRYDALLCAAAMGMRFASPLEMEEAIAEAARIECADWPARQRSRFQFARFRWNVRLGRIEDALVCAQRQVAICREEPQLYAQYIAMANVTGAELQLGHTEIALEHAQAAIAQLDAVGAGGVTGHLYINAMSALVLLERVDEALVAGRRAYAALLREGDELRVLTPLAACAALRGRSADAARICAFVDAEFARTGALRESGLSRVRDRVEALLDAELDPGERDRLRAEGAAMRDVQVFKLAFGNSPAATGSQEG